MNKTQAIQKHLLEYGSITSWQAIKEYGATRLSAIIYVLRDKGFIIETEMEEFTDRYGSKAKYGKYILKGLKNDKTN
jgi:hypothetical protein